jgi:hypothetical protein
VGFGHKEKVILTGSFWHTQRKSIVVMNGRRLWGRGGVSALPPKVWLGSFIHFPEGSGNFQGKPMSWQHMFYLLRKQLINSRRHICDPILPPKSTLKYLWCPGYREWYMISLKASGLFPRISTDTQVMHAHTL